MRAWPGSGTPGVSPREVLAGGGDVAPHLGDEVVRRIEPELVAEAVEKVDADLLAVDIALEAEDERLDGGPGFEIEGGADADVGARLVLVLADVGTGDLDAVGG